MAEAKANGQTANPEELQQALTQAMAEQSAAAGAPAAIATTVAAQAPVAPIVAT